MEKFERNKGITLIALVLIIIVLLLLAGVTISALNGENGVLIKTVESKEENRGAYVEEAKNLWKTNKIIDNKTNTDTVQTLDELLRDLQNQKILKQEEVTEIKETGKVSIGSKTIVFANIALLSDIVKKGDFVNYEAGIWKQDEIDNLGSLYSGKELPTVVGKFGGFQAGDSKDVSIETSTENVNKYSYGWRVLSINKDSNTIQLIHSGTPEGYYQGYYSGAGNYSYYIFTGKNMSTSYTGNYRKWSEYENLEYAVEGSARMPLYSDLLDLSVYNLKYPGSGYWYASLEGNGWTLKCYIKSSTNYVIGNRCLGIRPVITLKPNLKIDCSNPDIDGSSPDKAYILLNNL